MKTKTYKVTVVLTIKENTQKYVEQSIIDGMEFTDEEQIHSVEIEEIDYENNKQ